MQSTKKKYMMLQLPLVLFLCTAVFSCKGILQNDDWTTFVFDEQVTFSFEYPSSWTTTTPAPTTVRLTPPDNDDMRIELVVYDPEETPPLAVDVTYDTLRVVDAHPEPIPVLRRDPSAATERYFARVGINSHVVEFRLFAEENYNEVFDQMLITTKPNNTMNGEHNE